MDEIEDNTLTGTIPTELGQLGALKALNVGKNTLTGTIPIELANVLEMLYLSLGKRRILAIYYDRYKIQETTTHVSCKSFDVTTKDQMHWMVKYLQYWGISDN